MTALALNQDRTDAQRENANEQLDVTPLPWRQLLIVLLIRFAEPVTAVVIYPFINQFVQTTGVTGGDEEKTGYFAGMIQSIFFLAEAITVVFWGMASDRFGRRPVLIFGPLGLSIAMLGFGASTGFWSLVMFRCFQGVFNGNIGVTRAVIGEITDRTNMADAFAYVPVVWCMGVTIAPIIGGVFSSPAIRWPDTLGKLSYLRDHPYFLPCFIPSVLALVAFLGAFVGLKETLPSAILLQQRHQEEKSHSRSTSSTSLLEDSDALHYRSIEDNVRCRVGSWTKSEIPKPPPLRALLTPRVLSVIINQGFVCFCDISVQVLMPLVWSTSLEHGGLGFTSFTIGLTLGIFGVVNVFIQVLFLGKLIRRFGPRKVLIFSFPAFLVSLSCFPLEGYLARHAGGADWRVWAVIIVHLVTDSLKYYCYGALQILITDSAPCQSALGSMSGLAQAVGCIAKSLAPSVASSLFAISLQRNWAGGDAVYYILMGIVACGIRFSFMLPKVLQLERNPRFEDNTSPRGC